MKTMNQLRNLLIDSYKHNHFFKKMENFFSKARLYDEKIIKLHENFILLRSERGNIENDELGNTVSHETVNIEQNHWTKSALGYIKEIEQLFGEFTEEFGSAQNESFENQLKIKLINKYQFDPDPFINDNSVVFFKGSEIGSDRKVVVRALKKQEYLKEEEKEKIDQEINRNERLDRIFSYKDRNIIKVLGTYLDEYPKCLILEYIDGIPLKEILETLHFPFPKLIGLEISKNLAKAINYLHIHGELHCRIRPATILIDHEFEPIISPFEIIDSGQLDINRNNLVEELIYAPQELLSGAVKYLNEKTDQFSLGLVFYELFTGEKLFNGNSVIEVFGSRDRFFNSKKYSTEKLKKIENQKIQAIVKKMLSINPANRFSNIKEISSELNSIRVETSLVVQTILESYKRCCSNNSHFSTDFYSKLFQHPEYGDQIKAYFKDDEHGKKAKNRKRKLLSAILMLMGALDNHTIYATILSMPGHIGIQYEFYKIFIEVLIETVLENDTTYRNNKHDTAVREAWVSFKGTINQRINEVFESGKNRDQVFIRKS